jgi:eukaryotic-like serine/threonine-protein kinase
MILPGTRLGPYEVVSALGAGGMGEVYAARDTRLDRSVAIKILPPQLAGNREFSLRFEREARLISSLNHPHICTLHDVGEAAVDAPAEHGALSGGSDQRQQSVSYLVMELCDGQTLASRLEKGPLPIDQVLRIGIEIAGALDRAHRAGITHRDLKPANIMLTRSGTKLLDFGLAKPATILGQTTPSISASILQEGLTEQRPLTQEGTILGTFQYMAPEQLEGLEIDSRSDIFSFGAILYEMITGRRAFEGKTKASLIASILDREPPPIQEIQPLVPPPLTRIVSTCLAKDPEERWQSAHDLMRELEWIRDGISSGSPSTPHRAGRRGRDAFPWITAALFALVATAVTLAPREPSSLQQQLVTGIAPPPDARFAATGDAAGPVTLSPDGRWVTYVAHREGSPQLWVQSLETGNVTPLQGTQRAMFPFWSPDSRSIAFFSGSRLMVVDVDGSPSRFVADAPDARGGSWGPDDQILFAPHTQSGIHLIPATGGKARPLTRVEAPQTTHRWPHFLDDGKHFVYLAANHAHPTGSDTAIYLASVDGKVNLKLVETASSAVTRGDYLLYLRSNRLVAQRLREGTLEGEPIRIRDHVLHDPGTWRSIFSVSGNGLLAYHPAGAIIGTSLIWFDREGKELSQMPPRPVGDIAISPDGEKVAMVIGDPRGNLYIHDIARGVETRISFVEGAITSPVWSHDGRLLVFQSVNPRGFQLHIKPSDGSQQERRLVESPEELRPTDILPDGSAILFNGSKDGRGVVMALQVESGAVEPVMEGSGNLFDARLSPDGRWVSYMSNDSAGRNAYLSPFPPTGVKWQLASEPVYGAWWSRSGREIYFLTADHLNVVEISPAAGSIRPGAPARLFPISVNTNYNTIAVTPDGERFLVVSDNTDGSNAAVLIMNWDREIPRSSDSLFGRLLGGR